MNLHHILLIYKITIVLYENIIHWKQRKLGEIATFSKGNGYTKNDLTEKGKPIVLYGRLYTKYETVINDVDTFVEMKNKSVVSQGNEVVVPSSGETAEDISRASVIGTKDIILGGDLNIIKLNNEVNSIFLVLTVSNGTQQKEMIKRAQGKSVVHLSNSDLKQLNLLYPNLKEQQKIGTFFQQLDGTIALHQQKLDKLLLLKKAYLQQLFPENGQNVPNVRFANFTDDWKQRKLGDYVIDYIEKTTVQNQFPVLTSSQQRGIIFQEDYFSNRQVTTDSNIGYFVLPRGFFTFRSRSDNDIFVFNRNDIVDKGIISYFYPVFTLKSANSDFFLKRVNNGIQCQISIQAEGTGQHVLSLKKFKNILAKFPGEKEQNQIGNFFKQLDNTIALQQNKLLKLKKVKKAYLQKLFI